MVIHWTSSEDESISFYHDIMTWRWYKTANRGPNWYHVLLNGKIVSKRNWWDRRQARFLERLGETIRWGLGKRHQEGCMWRILHRGMVLAYLGKCCSIKRGKMIDLLLIILKILVQKWALEFGWGIIATAWSGLMTWHISLTKWRFFEINGSSQAN